MIKPKELENILKYFCELYHLRSIILLVNGKEIFASYDNFEDRRPMCSISALTLYGSYVWTNMKQQRDMQWFNSLVINTNELLLAIKRSGIYIVCIEAETIYPRGKLDMVMETFIETIGPISKK
ncbi:hypothetical protein SNEBB_004372 [Seison nebaliae]|nr:hypothetical protein SNEBB_004372 [Seison nebaliae]